MPDTDWFSQLIATPWLMVFVALTFVAAGVVKGTIGVGLPLLAVPLLALVLPPATAIALLAVPVLASNVWQALDGRGSRENLRRFLPLSVMLLITTLISVRLALSLPADVLTTLIAASVLCAVVLMLLDQGEGIAGPRERWMGPTVGVLAGAMGGVSSMTGPFIITYLMGLRLPREVFIGSISIIYLFGMVPLYASMAVYGTLGRSEALVSAVGLLPLALGMALGKRLRRRLSEAAFRRVLFAFLAGLALLLMLR